jgi:hypothetical protein
MQSIVVQASLSKWVLSYSTCCIFGHSKVLFVPLNLDYHPEYLESASQSFFAWFVLVAHTTQPVPSLLLFCLTCILSNSQVALFKHKA